MIWDLALHSLRHRPLRTVLTAAGIAIAVGSMVVFLSLGEGLRQAFADELSGLGAEIQISSGPFEATGFGSVPELPMDLMDEILEVGAPLGVTNVIPLVLYIRGGLTPSSSFAFQGIPTDITIEGIYPGYTVVEGRGIEPDDAGQNVAFVGTQAAERSNLEVGDTLRLTPEATFEIVGLVDASGGLLGNGILVPFTALQRAIGNDRASFFIVDIDDPAAADDVAASLAEAFPDLGVQTAGDVLSVIERGIRITDVVRLGISAIALIVGAIAVANTVLMSVFERTREFGVVRAVGARPRFLFGVVLAESILLSSVGGLFGVLLGQGGAMIVNAISIDLIGLNVAAITGRLIAFSVIVALAMGLLSGLAPSARAARIQIAHAVSQGN